MSTSISYTLLSLREKCPNTEFTGYRKIRTRKNFVFRHFSGSVWVRAICPAINEQQHLHFCLWVSIFCTPIYEHQHFIHQYMNNRNLFTDLWAPAFYTPIYENQPYLWIPAFYTPIYEHQHVIYQFMSTTNLDTLLWALVFIRLFMSTSILRPCFWVSAF